MNETTQRTLAVWAVFVLPFAAFGGYLATRGELTLEVVALYWFPAVVLTLIGTVPAPWEPLLD